MVNVMIVEDNAAFGKLLQHQLADMGISDVSTATGGAEALEILRQDTAVDVILCDWHMEPMDGLDFCASAQSISTERGRVVPIVFMTADAKLADADKRARMLEPARQIGIVDVLSKPFDADDLKTVLRNAGFAIP